jgi:myo-inositol-1(or 4)-monophosphatase
MTDLLLRTAIAAARCAAPELLAAFRGEMQVDFKRDRHDPVTEHDRRAEAMIRDLIFRDVPGSTFMGEEGGTTGTGAVHWFVDPIDGTSNFARGLPFWCTSVGAVCDGEILAGAIYDPVTETLFSASQAGAWVNGRPMRSRAVADEAQATLICGYPVTRDFRQDGRTEALAHFGTLTQTVATLRRPGSAALSLAHVAAGWVDAAAGFGVNPWDVTAGILLLEQAGGRYIPYPQGVVAATAAAHLHPGYLALGAGADYPTLEAVAAEISAGRAASARTSKGLQFG